MFIFFFFQAEDGIRDSSVTGVQTCALPISSSSPSFRPPSNSSTGSWVIKFAELDGGRKEGELLEPLATEKSDPGYPLELIRANVHGTVTLYAVIHADGKVGNIRVLNSPDERLDSYAAQALARLKFLPAERARKPVALEAVVVIPFRVRRSFCK